MEEVCDSSKRQKMRQRNEFYLLDEHLKQMEHLKHDFKKRFQKHFYENLNTINNT